jgi:hypothetical protein
MIFCYQIRMASNARPPRRFNLIEERLASTNYNAATRKANRAYLRTYTRKRNTESLTALVEKRQERAKALLARFGPASPKPALTARFVQKDVSGDGNCFYRALYRVAKEHKDPSILERVFEILGADKDAMKSETEGQAALRAAAARIVAGLAAKPEGIYEQLKEAKKAVEKEWFEALVDEAGYGIQPIYKRIGTYTRKKTGKANFYRNLGAAVGRNGEYASEADYFMVKDVLEAGGIRMISTHTRPKKSIVDGMPAIYLRRVNENHYNYWREI